MPIDDKGRQPQQESDTDQPIGLSHSGEVVSTNGYQASGLENPPTDGALFVVGIGASAGGLESLERLFSNMPRHTGMAFVVIQHLSPDFKSLMDELLARHTDLPILRAEDGMLVVANTIYLIPPKKDMIISAGRLLLTDKDPKQTLTMPIDRFFRSLAQDVGDRCMGVILSGTGSDGSRGIRDIHNSGGLVLCETKDTAKFDGMPQAAMETGVVDQVMPAENVPAALIQHKTHKISGSTEDEPSDAPIEGINIVFKLLNDEYGIDFTDYKPNTVSRRIQRRLSLIGSRTIDQYAKTLQEDPEELNSLYKDLLIGVTRFFRDRDAFEKLETEIVPELIEKVTDDGELRVWVAACATGEEAYSLAMILHEQLEKSDRTITAKIFATDVHHASLEIAGAGVYNEDSLADVSPQRLERFFERKADGYHVSPDLRQMIVFATHNVIDDAPFTKLDLITCRNLLIYFQPSAQYKALSLFHFGLRTGGCLFLGPSETPGPLLEEFELVDVHWKLYRKRRDAQLPSDIELPVTKSVQPLRPTVHPAHSHSRGLPEPSLLTAYDRILEKFMPAGLLINEKRELLHSFGGAECFLRPRGGRPSGDVLDMLDRELRTAVTGAVHKALRDNIPVSYSGVRVRLDDKQQVVRVSIVPIDNPRSSFAQLLITIEPVKERLIEKQTSSSKVIDQDMRQMSEDRIDSLEDELSYTKENLQTTIEELETSNEEMQATNEELVASNEELQSTNEELQSVNEELYTVNAEYQKKIVELSEMTSDMDNLLDSTDIGTIFLDRDLKIRKFTPQIGLDFHLLPQDIGRSITSFAHNIVYPRLIEDLRQVVERETTIEKDVRDQKGKYLYVRILPYRTKSRQVDGVVLTLIDITPVKKAQEQLSEAVTRRDQFLAMLSHELRNPLGAILNSTQVMDRMEVTDPTLRETCDVVRRQSRLMSRLLDDLLDVSRVTQNKIELKMGPVDMRSILNDAVESVCPLLEASQLRFSQDMPDEPMLVHGDAARLQQAVSNLLANAAKYTPNEGQVSLQAINLNDEVIVRVHDTGIGIREDKLESLFELFVQSDHSLHRSEGGMGIGLTLARSIIEMHEGRISAQSDGPGCGSTFEVRLPRINLELYNPDETVEQSTDSLASSDNTGCIVVVEDEADARNMLCKLLELEGYEVHQAENGTKGLALIERVHPDIALVDIGLPGIDGYELARQLRENLGNRHTYLVAITGYGQQNDIEAAIAAGFDNHLVKPLDPTKLASILEIHGARSEKTVQSS